MFSGDRTCQNQLVVFLVRSFIPPSAVLWIGIPSEIEEEDAQRLRDLGELSLAAAATVIQLLDLLILVPCFS
ncbi:hypothetical protein DM860_001166 [Cuscuta australis]|uniref:Uncharacterized protein n=1 Tax=Cuscuta australis TaxID=267555 RepID=A0A328DU34_9ASTE|nr:hypothetical protein DM860_001166 [Cuscuta australis]